MAVGGKKEREGNLINTRLGSRGMREMLRRRWVLQRQFKIRERGEDEDHLLQRVHSRITRRCKADTSFPLVLIDPLVLYDKDSLTSEGRGRRGGNRNERKQTVVNGVNETRPIQGNHLSRLDLDSWCESLSLTGPSRICQRKIPSHHI